QSIISSRLTTAASHILKVYRGQLMSYEKFQQIQQNIGGFIAINTFLSTTLDKTAATFFSGEGKSRPEYESVVFSIHIDKTMDYTKTPYANVQHLSKMQDEYEIILSVGILLKIDSIEELDNYWNIKLIVCNEEFQQHLCDFEQMWQDECDKLSNDEHLEYSAILYLSLSVTLLMLGEVEKGFRYLYLHVNQLPENHRKEYMNRGFEGAFRHIDGSVDVDEEFKWVHMFEPIYQKFFKTSDKKCDPQGIEENSVQIHEKVLLSIISTSDLDTKPDYHRLLAYIYERQQNFEKALVHYEKALELRYAQPSVRNSVDISHLHKTIGEIYKHLERHIEAIKHFNMSLDQFKKILPLNHYLYAVIYQHIGEAYWLNKEYHSSLKYFQQASTILESSDEFRTKYNIPLADVYELIALTYFLIKDYREAVLANKKAIKLNINPLRYRFYQAVWDCGESYFYLNDFDQAYEYYQKALDLLLKYHRNRTADIALAYDGLGRTWKEQIKYHLALENFEKSLQYFSEASLNPSEEQCFSNTLSKLPEVYKAIAHCHSKLSSIEAEKGNRGKFIEYTNQSLLNYKKALDLQVKYLPEGDLRIAETKCQIAETYMGIARFQDSVKLLEELLVTYTEKLHSEYKLHARIYKVLGFTWSFMGDYDKARKYYGKAGSIIFDQPQPDEDVVKQYLQELNDMENFILQNQSSKISNSAPADSAC
ncbi:unnamed protein product, partial [Rotaria socialis]